MSSEPWPRTIPQNYYPTTVPVPAPSPPSDPEAAAAWNKTLYCPPCRQYVETDRHTQQVPTNTNNPNLPAFIICTVCGWLIDTEETG